jgi:hypothetical protein
MTPRGLVPGPCPELRAAIWRGGPSGRLERQPLPLRPNAVARKRSNVAKDGVFGQRSGECGPIHAVQDEVEG